MMRRPIGREVARTAVIAGTATAVSGRVARREEERYAGTEAAAVPQYEPSPGQEPGPEPPARAGPSPEAIEQLKELAALKDQGILTDEEFTAQKAKILGA